MEKVFYTQEEYNDFPLYTKWMYSKVKCKLCQRETNYYAFTYVIGKYNIECENYSCSLLNDPLEYAEKITSLRSSKASQAMVSSTLTLTSTSSEGQVKPPSQHGNGRENHRS